MCQQNEKIKIILVDICSISEKDDEEWSVLHQNNKIIFLAICDIGNRKQILSKYGEVCHFNGVDNPFSVLADNNILVEILDKYDCNSNEAIIVTSDNNHLMYFSNYNIRCAHITKKWCNYKIAPDYICQNVKSLVDVTTGKNGGFFAEALLQNKIKDKYCYLLKNNCEVNGKAFTIWAGGRYFAQGTAQSHYHLLSSKIISNKRDGREFNDFTTIFYEMITSCVKIKATDMIISIPPKPGKANRFNRILDNLSHRLNINNGDNFLYCNKDYGNNKIRGAHDREISLEGAFSVSDGINLVGRDVILIDDVLASGATIKEFVKVLYDAGVATVTVFVIGLNQLTSQWRNVRYVPLKCSLCDGEMNLRINSYNLRPFYGCENYPNCNFTLDYDDGYQIIKKQNTMRLIDTGEDFIF